MCHKPGMRVPRQMPANVLVFQPWFLNGARSGCRNPQGEGPLAGVREDALRQLRQLRQRQLGQLGWRGRGRRLWQQLRGVQRLQQWGRQRVWQHLCSKRRESYFFLRWGYVIFHFSVNQFWEPVLAVTLSSPFGPGLFG